MLPAKQLTSTKCNFKYNLSGIYEFKLPNYSLLLMYYKHELKITHRRENILCRKPGDQDFFSNSARALTVEVTSFKKLCGSIEIKLFEYKDWKTE